VSEQGSPSPRSGSHTPPPQKRPSAQFADTHDCPSPDGGLQVRSGAQMLPGSSHSKSSRHSPPAGTRPIQTLPPQASPQGAVGATTTQLPAGASTDSRHVLKAAASRSTRPSSAAHTSSAVWRSHRMRASSRHSASVSGSSTPRKSSVSPEVQQE
jgi:hypothetical protein